MNKKFFWGFTLAEILIAVAIVGIIAALTIPGVVSNYNQKALITQLQKNYIELQEALLILKTENYHRGLDGSILNKKGSKTVANTAGRFLREYYKILDDCGSDTQPCFADKYADINSLTDTDFSCADGYSVTVASGAAICIIPAEITDDDVVDNVTGAPILKDIDKDIKVIIIEDSIDKRLSEYKTLSKIAECTEYNHLDERQMTQFIIQILKKYNVNISYEDAQYMQSICGNDKYNNINELQKLVIYVQSGFTVTKDIIDKVCSKTLNAKIFDVLDDIVNKRKDIAIEELNSLLRQKEPIVKIYIMLYKQFKQLYMIKLLKKSGDKNIAQTLGIAPFIVKKLSTSCDKYSEKELKNIIYAFDSYDQKTKNGDMDFVIGLKEIICML